MINVETKLNVIDNSDAIIVKCIHLVRGSFRRCSRLGDILVVALQKRRRTKNLIKRDIQLAVISGSRFNSRRKNGHYIKFKRNSVFLIKNDYTLVGTRIRGVMAIEIFNNS